MRFEGTATYVAGDELKTAVNAAIALERPLLVKGEPGTGKTLLAQEIAGALGAPFIAWHIKSTTRAQQGLYEYDAVSRLRDSQLGDPRVSDIANYIRRGKLWEAFTSPDRPVLLIDEIDKADIEFPNDLLLELDQMEFHVYETGETVKARLRPIVIITSNNEKELPDAFLRRCFFHYIRFPDAETMRLIVESHYPSIKPRLVEEAMRSFFALARNAGIEKEADHLGAARLAEAAAERRRLARNVARARRQEADPSPARRAAQERTGRASVREARVPEPAGAVGDGSGRSAVGVTPAADFHSPACQSISPHAIFADAPIVSHSSRQGSAVRRARRLRANADRSRPRRRPAGRGGAGRPPHAARRSCPFRRGASQGDGRDFRRRVAARSRARRGSRRSTTRPQTMLFARARALSNAHARVGLVGHNPGLGELAVALAGSGAQPELRHLAAKYPTGAVAVLDFSVRRWEDVERNSAMLALYLTPAELEAGAD